MGNKAKLHHCKLKNCHLGLVNAALFLQPRAAFSRPRSQCQPPSWQITFILVQDFCPLTAKIACFLLDICLNVFFHFKTEHKLAQKIKFYSMLILTVLHDITPYNRSVSMFGHHLKFLKQRRSEERNFYQ